MFFKKNSFLEISFVDSKQIQALNEKYLKHDYPTDVLSFNMDEKLPDGRFYIGDVIVNLDMVRTEQEVAKLAEHGIKHLLGIHHKEN